jgi:hypothetical protein
MVTVVQHLTALVNIRTVDIVCIKLKSLIATARLNTTAVILRTNLLTVFVQTRFFRYASDVVHIQSKSIVTAAFEGTGYIATHVVTWNTTSALVHIRTVSVVLQQISCEAFTAEEGYLIQTYLLTVVQGTI